MLEVVFWSHARHWLEISILWQVYLKHLERLHILHKWHGFAMPPWRTTWSSTAGDVLVDILWYLFLMMDDGCKMSPYSFFFSFEKGTCFMFWCQVNLPFDPLFLEGVGSCGLGGLVAQDSTSLVNSLAFQTFNPRLFPRTLGSRKWVWTSWSLPLRWWQLKYFFIIFTPFFWGFMIQFDERAYFLNGLVQPPTSLPTLGPGLKRPNTMQFWKPVAFYPTWKPCPMAIWRRSARRVWIFQVRRKVVNPRGPWCPPVFFKGRSWCLNWGAAKPLIAIP